MTNERVIEIPWALAQLPQSGVILDVGSCDATYLESIVQPDRRLHCLDPRDCSGTLPPGMHLHRQSLIGNTLPQGYYDAILVLSTLEHIGLPCYGQHPFLSGDRLAIAEVRRLLKRNGIAIFTVPAGQSKIASWYRQYSPDDLRRLFSDWQIELSFWGYNGTSYHPIAETDVCGYDYRDCYGDEAGAGALAGIIARP